MTQTVDIAHGGLLKYDEPSQTIEMWLKEPSRTEMLWNTSAEVRNFFSELLLQWARLTANKRVFWIISDLGFTMTPEAQEMYLAQIDFITRVTAKDVFVYGDAPATHAVSGKAKRFKTYSEAACARDSALCAPTKRLSHFYVDTVRCCRNGVTLSFDTKNQIIEVKVPAKPSGKKYFLETDFEVKEHMHDVRAAWLSGSRGRKAFFLIDYENFDVNPSQLDLYTELVDKFIGEAALSVVRYNANLLQSTAIRYKTVKGASPVNLFRGRADAVEVVEALTDGLVTFDKTDDPVAQVAYCTNGIKLVYDRDTLVFEVSAPKHGRQYLIDTGHDVKRYLQELTLAWTEMTNSKPVYWLVNYEDFSVNPAVRPVFDRGVGELMHVAALKLVRYHTTLAQKIALRRRDLVNPGGLALYNSRREAFEAILGK